MRSMSISIFLLSQYVKYSRQGHCVPNQLISQFTPSRVLRVFYRLRPMAQWSVLKCAISNVDLRLFISYFLHPHRLVIKGISRGARVQVWFCHATSFHASAVSKLSCSPFRFAMPLVVVHSSVQSRDIYISAIAVIYDYNRVTTSLQIDFMCDSFYSEFFKPLPPPPSAHFMCPFPSIDDQLRS